MQTSILLVDDSPTQLMSLRIALEGEGYRVVTAKNGIDGVNKAYEAVPQAVISDIVMPELNGYQFCRILKNDPEMRQTPFILLTALGESVHRFWGIEAGADYYITKGRDHEEIRQRLRILLRSPTAHRPPSVRSELIETVQSKVNEIFDELLFEFTISNKLKELSLCSHDPDLMYSQVFGLLRQLFDFRCCVLARVTPQHTECVAHHAQGQEHEELSALKTRVLESLPVETREKPVVDKHIPTDGPADGPSIGTTVVFVIESEPKSAIGFAQFQSTESDTRTDKTLVLISEELGRTISYVYKLEEIEAVQADFHSMLVHDLRSPLTSIIGFSRLINKMQKELDPQVLHMSGIMVKQGQKMLELVNDFLDVSKIAADTGNVEVWVRDTGVGIGGEDAASLFESYFQTKSSATGKEKSSGLGLAICKHIVEAHGGIISVESEPGVGSTFTFTLPCGHRR